MSEETTYTGLGKEPRESWPRISASSLQAKPIDLLKPQSPLHTKVLEYLRERIQMSEREMQNFYPRWRAQELRVQAFIDLNDWERQLKEFNQDKGKAAKVVSVTIPYMFATISTIVTYMVHTFCGRKPMFQVGSYKKETLQNAAMMELVLQYNADHTRLIRHMFQFLMDQEVYGVGILRTQWKNKKALRTVRKTVPRSGFFGVMLGNTVIKTRELRTVYSGNDVAAQDPYMFLPDPRVPMVEVNKKGEFVFWRTYDGKHSLKTAEARGEIKYVDAIPMMGRDTRALEESNRARLSQGTAHPGLRGNTAEYWGGNFYQIDQGSVEIIPAELGLGRETRPEKWIFTIANDGQIVQAEPAELDHDMHPVAVTEPYGLGYGFGHPGISDFLGPIQDTLSWFVNSHIANVRTVLNNMIIVDPSMIEMQDLKNPDPGKLVRLKPAAYGRDIRTVLQQMQVQDVTQGHIRDFETFSRIGDALSSVNDNVRGLQDSGGRKTATEVRTSGEASASRLAAHARLTSAQGVVDLVEQMSINVQQFMEDEFYISLVGQEGIAKPLTNIVDESGGIQVRPEMLAGDFYYPIHDGTLPLDRVAMLDVWKEIFLAVAQDQELRSAFSVQGIFEYLAELGGAKNLDKFKVNVNTLPLGGEPPKGAVPVPISSTQTPGVQANPGARMAGGL